MQKKITMFLTLSLLIALSANAGTYEQQGKNTLYDQKPVQSSSAGRFAMPAYHYEGRSQSPIDLKDAYELDIVDTKFQYTPSVCVITNTGRFTKVVAKKDNFIIVDKTKYKLEQFHFHTPSEHYIEGVLYPMEIHFVHQDEQGNLAVIGVLVKKGKKNKQFQSIIDAIPESAGSTKGTEQKIDFMAFLPKIKLVYRYNGSLTTPPFTEGVKWIVMKDVVSLSKKQIKQIFKIIGKSNRALQKLNGRALVLDSN